MQKPIDLIIIETKQNIAKAANEGQLPLSILQMILNEMLTQVTMQLNTQLPQLKQQYEEEVGKASQ